MKNIIKVLVVFLMYVTLMSCEKDLENIGEPYHPATSSEQYETESTLITNETAWLRALSKWVATPEAKQWLVEKRGFARDGNRLDEVLVLEILCNGEGRVLTEMYNDFARTTHSPERLADELYAENAMLGLKYDAYFDEFLDNIGNFTPLMSNKDRDMNYFNGEPYNAREALEEVRGALIIGFRLVEAENTVLYNPSTNTMNRELGYPFCNEQIFASRLNEFSDPICSGEIPLSITEEVQRIFYEICGDDFTFTGGPDVEICDNGIDDDGDGLIDDEDPDCIPLSMEICDNGIDDDGDGFVDGDDEDCINYSPCMRDQHLEDNYYHELELVRPEAIVGPGGNLCQGIQTISQNPFGVEILSSNQRLFPEQYDGLSGLEEQYNFLIKTHWGTPSGPEGMFQDLIYEFYIWDLVNAPVFNVTYYNSWAFNNFFLVEVESDHPLAVAVLFVETQGLTETKPVSLLNVPFYSASDICGVNNWNPAYYGDKVGISIHEGDGCTLRTTDGEVITTATQNTYTSSFNINLGLGPGVTNFVTGGIMYNYVDVLATTETNSINSSYTTSYSDDYYVGRANYSYCWADQGTTDQIHEMNFGNLINLRILSRICD